MNPSSNETGLNLPTPVEQSPPVPGTSETGTQAAEQAPAPPERAPGTGPATALPAIPLPPLPRTAAPPPTPPSNTTTPAQSAVLDVADDGDLIEKEWVNKAKAIVERTRDDPHRQSEELTVFKADYMKKRYDKTVKVNK